MIPGVAGTPSGSYREVPDNSLCFIRTSERRKVSKNAGKQGDFVQWALLDLNQRLPPCENTTNEVVFGVSSEGNMGFLREILAYDECNNNCRNGRACGVIGKVPDNCSGAPRGGSPASNPTSPAPRALKADRCSGATVHASESVRVGQLDGELILVKPCPVAPSGAKKTFQRLDPRLTLAGENSGNLGRAYTRDFRQPVWRDPGVIQETPDDQIIASEFLFHAVIIGATLLASNYIF